MLRTNPPTRGCSTCLRHGIVRPPDLSVNTARPSENVAVVRHAIGGLGEALAIATDVSRTQARRHRGVHQRRRARLPRRRRPARGRRLLAAAAAADRRDKGRGIVPRTDSPGLGLGLPLIATLAEALELGTTTRTAPRCGDLPPRRDEAARGVSGDVTPTRPGSRSATARSSAPCSAASWACSPLARCARSTGSTTPCW